MNFMKVISTNRAASENVLFFYCPFYALSRVSSWLQMYFSITIPFAFFFLLIIISSYDINVWSSLTQSGPIFSTLQVILRRKSCAIRVLSELRFKMWLSDFSNKHLNLSLSPSLHKTRTTKQVPCHNCSGIPHTHTPNHHKHLNSWPINPKYIG